MRKQATIITKSPREGGAFFADGRRKTMLKNFVPPSYLHLDNDDSLLNPSKILQNTPRVAFNMKNSSFTSM